MYGDWFFWTWYEVMVTVSRQYSPNIVKEMDLWVKNVQALPPPEINNSIKMEVGIEDCLHIEFEYNRSKYHLKDVVIGKIYFLLVRLKIKHMEIEIRKRESTGDPFLCTFEARQCDVMNSFIRFRI